MDTIKIAFFGRAGVGKDWIAKKVRDWCETNLNIPVIRLAFADPLKKDIASLTSMSREQWSNFLFSPDFKTNKYVDFDTYKIWDFPDKSHNVLTAKELYIKGGPGPNDMCNLRELCVYYGTYVMRFRMGPNIWTYRLFNSQEYKYMNERKSLITITDVRFNQEYERCKQEGFTMIKVERPGVKSLDNIAESYLSGMKADITVVNDKPNYFDVKNLIQRVNEL